jgi:2-polyprenyl-3-methyl-5-hydroxy-6-metoxy-1,4-benzoquinol methylase
MADSEQEYAMPAHPGYDPVICDLCGSLAASSLLHLTTGRAMRSDRQLVAADLSKLHCTACGLVRSGAHLADQQLQSYYVHDYELSTRTVEHQFYTPQGAVPRSAVLCDWLVSAMGSQRWRQARHCLEIGAGSGDLLHALALRFPNTAFEGVELSAAAAALAQRRGYDVRQGDLEAALLSFYDIIYTVAVLEHVTSPTRFLQAIQQRLRPGGWLFLCQPTQDTPSYDLFFSDHIYHFGSEHLRQYARKTGFREQGMVVGHELMPNFSLHLWQKADPAPDWAWLGAPGYTTCCATAAQVLADMARLDMTLSMLGAQGRPVAVFGLNEVYWLTKAYSSLGDFPIACGLDDRPSNPEYAHFPFPVVVPEECQHFGVRDVLLTMNRLYYHQASERLAGLGLHAYPVLDSST